MPVRAYSTLALFFSAVVVTVVDEFVIEALRIFTTPKSLAFLAHCRLLIAPVDVKYFIERPVLCKMNRALK